MVPIVAQAANVSAATLFYVTLIVIFVTAIITAVLTKWARDKCLKFFNHYHVTMERSRGQTVFGGCKIFPSGVEIVFDHPFVRTGNEFKDYGEAVKYRGEGPSAAAKLASTSARNRPASSTDRTP